MGVVGGVRILLLLVVAYLNGPGPLSTRTGRCALRSGCSNAGLRCVTESCVSLLPNFSCAPSSNGAFRTRVSPTLLFPPASGAVSPASKNVINDVPKRFEIGPVKTTACALPVSYPRKVGGMRPGVSLICSDGKKGKCLK